MKEQNQKKVEDQITKACKDIEQQAIKASKRRLKLHPPSPTRIIDLNELEQSQQSQDNGQKNKEKDQEEEKADEEPEMEQEEMGEKLDSIIDDQEPLD